MFSTISIASRCVDESITTDLALVRLSRCARALNEEKSVNITMQYLNVFNAGDMLVRHKGGVFVLGQC